MVSSKNVKNITDREKIKHSGYGNGNVGKITDENHKRETNESIETSAGRMGSRNKCCVVKLKEGGAKDDKELNTWTASTTMSPISHSATLS